MFNDPIAVDKFKQLVNEFGVKTAVETGTEKAFGTLNIARFINKVYSVEINQEFFEGAKARLISEGFAQAVCREHISFHINGTKEITLFWSNSPEVISQIIEYLEEPIIFYLDAHWTEYWPIKDEIRAIKPRPNSLIIIHDFKVPGKPFGYDIYGGQALDFAFIKEDLAYVNPNYKFYYNEEAAGSCRGILYALPKEA